MEQFSSITAWVDALAQRRWTGGFDLPFGLPRAWVEAQAADGWPQAWQPCMHHYAQTDRAALRTRFRAWCDARPAGHKFAHRATDGLAGSSPSMKWVNPPVAWMMHAGVPPLLEMGAWFPAHQPRPVAAPERVALEAYPGLLAREVLGRTSYKADDPARQDAARVMARKTLLDALERGQTRLGLRLKLSPAQGDALVADPSGDSLDAVLCLMQTAWAWQRRDDVARPFDLPPDVDPLEGWIVTA